MEPIIKKDIQYMVKGLSNVKQVIKKNEFFLINGPAEVEILEGVIEAIAARKTKGEKVSIPVGKKVPMLGIEDSVIEFKGDSVYLTKMEASSIPAEWDVLADKIVAHKRKGELTKIVVLGEVDTGKTFFSTYLANRLIQKLGTTAILDCDAGQSDIGCPGTFGMLMLKKPEIFLTELEPTYTYMIGAHSSGLHFVPALTGLINMLQKADKEAEALIIDTTGWVQFDGGRAIKKAKLDIVNPDYVVLMQRGNELEHLVKHLPSEKVVRLPVSKKASPTSQMDRKALRELVSRRYFINSKVFEIPFNQVYTDRVYFRTGTPIKLAGTVWAEKLSGFEGTLVISEKTVKPEQRAEWPKDLGMIRNFTAGNEIGLMLALLDNNGDVLQVARLEKIDFKNEKFIIRSKYNGNLENIKGIQFGSLKLTAEGNEAGFIEPGIL